MAKFCVEGNRTFDQIAEELDIPYRRTGKLVVGFTPEDREKLEELKAQGERNGIEGIRMVERDFIDKKAPCVGGEFRHVVPDDGDLKSVSVHLRHGGKTRPKTAFSFSLTAKSPRLPMAA